MVMSFLFWDCHNFRGHLHSWGLHLFEIVFIFFFKTYLFLRLLTCFRLSLGCNTHSLLLQASKRGNQIWKLKLVNSVTTKTEQFKVYSELGTALPQLVLVVSARLCSISKISHRWCTNPCKLWDYTRIITDTTGQY